MVDQMAVDSWLQRFVLEPTAALLASTDVGADPLENGDLVRLCIGIDGIFRTELPVQWPSWPAGSTTDGCLAASCERVASGTLVTVGLTWMDFGGDGFPFRATFQVSNSKELRSFRAEIGEVDQNTGEPPRFRVDTSTIVADRDSDGPITGYVLYAPRRPKRIEWTPVVTLEPTSSVDTPTR
jgi:hypothetical protein